jgi:outer membrane autotransporter protein
MTPSLWPGRCRVLRQSFKRELVTKSGESPGSDKPPTLNAGAVAVGLIKVAVHLGLVVGLYLGVASPLLAQITQDAYVPNTDDNTVSVIDTATHSVTNTIPVGAFPYGAAVTPDGLHAYVSNDGSNTVSVIDTATHAIVNTIAVGSFPLGIAVTPDGLHAYVANSGSSTVSVIDTATNAVVNTILVNTAPFGVAVTPDGLHVLVSNNLLARVSEIDTATHTVVAFIPVGGNPFGVAVTPDGLHAYVANSGDGTVSVIQTAAPFGFVTIPVGGNPTGVAVTPDGLHVYVSNLGDNTVSEIDTATNMVVNTIGVGPGPFGVAVTPDGLHVYVTNRDGNTVSEIDTATQAVVNTITVGNSPRGLGDFVGPNLITGTLSLANEAALTGLGFGQFVDFRGGTLQTLASLNDTHTLSLIGTGGTIDTNGFNSTFSGNVIGPGALTKTGAGTLTLAGSNIYSGGTNINGGVLAVSNDNNLGTGPLSFGGGTLEVLATDGGITSSKAITFNALGGTFLADANTTSTLSGAITGVGAFTKDGAGRLVLSGASTYSGVTTVSAGVLQAGSNTAFSPNSAFTVNSVLDLAGFSNTVGSLAGSGTVTNNGGPAILTAGGNGTNTVFSGTLINGTGSLGLIKAGPGTLTLSGANTYTGGTVLNAGTLTVNGTQALGLGNLVVNGGILNADTPTINVKGNYTQNPGGTLQLRVAGSNPGQYDSLDVAGHAALGGNLQLIFLGFQPKISDQLTLVLASGGISGKFANFNDPFNPVISLELVYGPNSVVLEFGSDFASLAETPNERAAANLLDRVAHNPKAAESINFLFNEPLSNLPGDLERISPDSLASFYEISFSNAIIQKLNLEGRMDEIHNGSNGFSSNMKMNGATVNLEDRADADGKSSKAVVEPVLQHAPENRWGVWVTGFGDFVNVDSDGNGQGYDFTTGGVSLGIDYRITDQLAIGAMGEYSHTWTSLNPSGDIDVDSGRGGLYATWFNQGIYLNAAIYGGHNTYESGRAGLGGLANGGTEGSEWSTFIGGGYDFHFGPLTVGPIASLQYTDVGIDSFSEKGSLAPLAIHSDSVESLRSDVGFRLFYQWQIGKIVVEPSLKAAWEHEYKYSALPITAGFAGIPGPSATFFGPSEGHDSAVVSAGVSVQLTPAISTYVNYDGQLGRDNYDSNAVTGGVRISF